MMLEKLAGFEYII